MGELTGSERVRTHGPHVRSPRSYPADYCLSHPSLCKHYRLSVYREYDKAELNTAFFERSLIT